ncbi:cholecystokinin receptor-like [Amphiura filiformis]|uniref:cholecystokinin receptor-like n=1 Tax=Amphiura filiformis TaxID=82378 RepID=UPI003B21ACD0
MSSETNSTTDSDDLVTSESSGGNDTIDKAVLYLSVFKITIGIIGICGNMMVLIIMKLQTHKGKFLIRSQAFIDMLTSMAFIADAFTGLYPPTVPQHPIIGYIYCIVWHYFATVFVLFSLSTYNLVAISIERYILVLYPMYYRAYFTRTKEVLLGVSSWFLAPIMQLTYVLSQIFYDNENKTCILILLRRGDILGVFIFVWDFFIPCLVMGYCFATISVRLYQQDKEAKGLKGHSSIGIESVSGTVSTTATSSAGDSNQQKYVVDAKSDDDVQVAGKEESVDEYRRSRNVTKTFIIIFVVYIFCWITNQLLFLQMNLGGYTHWGRPESHFANGLAMLNSACNPFIYVLHMKQYRDKVRSFFSNGL